MEAEDPGRFEEALKDIGFGSFSGCSTHPVARFHGALYPVVVRTVETCVDSTFKLGIIKKLALTCSGARVLCIAVCHGGCHGCISSYFCLLSAGIAVKNDVAKALETLKRCGVVQLLDGYKLDDLDVFQKAFEQLKLREKAYQKLLDQQLNY